MRTCKHVQTVKSVFRVLETQAADSPCRTSRAGFNHLQYNNQIFSHICVTPAAVEAKCVCGAVDPQHNTVLRL